MSREYWIGVDLGGTKILAGLFDENMNLLARAKHPTSSESGPAGVFARIDQVVETVVREAKIDPTRIRGMGFGIPGQIDLTGTKVIFAPNLDWHDLDVKPFVPKSWTWPVILENDVRMGTYGEFAHGAARGARHVFGVFAGTGVGGGFILNGEVFAGFNGNAGEFGHLIVQWRQGVHLEAIAGRKFQLKRAKKLLADAPKSVRKEWKGTDLSRMKSSKLAEYYRKGEPIVTRIVDDAARAIGVGIASVVNLINPEVIVVGGGVAEALGESFIERIWDVAQRYALPGADANVRCVPAALGDDAGITGCAAYAKKKLAGCETTPP